MNFPEDVKYHDAHMWARALPEGVAEVGISDFAQAQLGTVIYVDLPEPGDRVSAGLEMGAVESAKSVSDIISPVNGQVLEVNSPLEDTPKLINQSPFGEGWIARIKLDDPAGLDSLLDAAAYRGQVE